jgi:hypothetical protein
MPYLPLFMPGYGRRAVFETQSLPNLIDCCRKNLNLELSYDFIGQFWCRFARVLESADLNEGNKFT